MQKTQREGKKESLWKKIPSSKGYVSIIDANFFQRILAFFVDMLIYKAIVFVILVILMYQMVINPDELFSLAFYRTNIYEYPENFMNLRDLIIHVFLSGLFIGYFTVFESKHAWGRTPGKYLLGLKVIDEKGNKLSLRDSFFRNSTKYFLRIPFIGLLFGVIELALIFFYFRRTGDLIVQSRVASGLHKT